MQKTSEGQASGAPRTAAEDRREEPPRAHVSGTGAATGGEVWSEQHLGRDDRVVTRELLRRQRLVHEGLLARRVPSRTQEDAIFWSKDLKHNQTQGAREDQTP